MKVVAAMMFEAVQFGNNAGEILDFIGMDRILSSAGHTDENGYYMEFNLPCATIIIREGDYLVKDIEPEGEVDLRFGEDLGLFDKETFEKRFKVVEQ